MNSQLKWKFVLIAAAILLCIYGVIGLPVFPTSGTQIKQNLADRIKLGLDLKGGSHLVLQVQVEEAIGQRCDQTIDLLTGSFTTRTSVLARSAAWTTRTFWFAMSTPQLPRIFAT